MTSTVSKSYFGSGDPIIDYCTKMTVQLDPLQQELHDSTLKHPASIMLGAPEVLTMGQNFIKLINGKKALDIGTFTGASALAWSLALPEDGKVITFDISHDALNEYGMKIIEKNQTIRKKIDFQLGNAVDLLDQMIADGQEGTFDFAFIDADKPNYKNYYKRCMQLLRKGGVILVDNALFFGRVVQQPRENLTQGIYECNEIIHNDPNSMSMLVNVGDGLHIVFKK